MEPFVKREPDAMLIYMSTLMQNWIGLDNVSIGGVLQKNFYLFEYWVLFHFDNIWK